MWIHQNKLWSWLFKPGLVCGSDHKLSNMSLTTKMCRWVKKSSKQIWIQLNLKFINVQLPTVKHVSLSSVLWFTWLHCKAQVIWSHLTGQGIPHGANFPYSDMILPSHSVLHKFKIGFMSVRKKWDAFCSSPISRSHHRWSCRQKEIAICLML